MGHGIKSLGLDEITDTKSTKGPWQCRAALGRGCLIMTKRMHGITMAAALATVVIVVIGPVAAFARGHCLARGSLAFGGFARAHFL